MQYCTLTPASAAAAPISVNQTRPAVALRVSDGSRSCSVPTHMTRACAGGGASEALLA